MKGITTIIFLLIFSTTVFSQFSAIFKYQHGFVHGDFSNNLSEPLRGVSGEFLTKAFRFENLFIGGTFTWGSYQEQGFTAEPFSSSSTVITSEDDEYYVYQGIFRYFLKNEKSSLRPFVQLQAGGISFHSNFETTDDMGLSYDYDREFYGSTWLMGFSGGAHLRLIDFISLHAKVGYNFSGITQYRSIANLEDIPNQNIILPFPLQESRVNHFFFDVGIAVNF